LLLFAGLPACADDRSIIAPPPDDCAELCDTPRENEEAEEAALWLSGQLVAPEDLYRIIRDDLTAIRAAYLDSIPELAIEFTPWWLVSKIGIDVTEETRQKLLAREPNAVDSLNTVFRATHMDTFRLKVEPFVVVYFEGRLHPERLSEIYDELTEVTLATPAIRCCDWDNVYPWRIDGGASCTPPGSRTHAVPALKTCTTSAPATVASTRNLSGYAT